MKTKIIFYIAGISILAKGLLVLNGVKLPKRDGTVIENPFEYGIEAIVIGVVIIIATAIVSYIMKNRQKK